MFETPEIRTSFINAIVSWIEINYDLHENEQLENIRTSLTSLSDEELYHAGEEVETFEKESKNTISRLDRQILSVEHSVEEDQERSNVTLNLFS